MPDPFDIGIACESPLRCPERVDAVEIIDEIRQLPPSERARIVRYLLQLEEDEVWTGPQLTGAAAAMVNDTDPAKAQLAWERIARGFYGKKPDA